MLGETKVTVLHIYVAPRQTQWQAKAYRWHHWEMIFKSFVMMTSNYNIVTNTQSVSRHSTQRCQRLNKATQGHKLHYMLISWHCHTGLIAHPASSSKHANRRTTQQKNAPTQPNAKLPQSAHYKRLPHDSTRSGSLIF
jgi:hypothetical protein